MKIPWFVRARLKTRQLMLLVAIDEEGNIQRAAKTLNMSQPAASKLLKDLEDMMEVRLFERLPRGMLATWYGEVMIRHARVALTSIGEAGAEIEALKAGYAGSVSLGAISAAISMLPEAIKRVVDEHPKLRVSVLIESSDILLERLAQNKLDILIARLFARHDKSDLHYEMLAEEPVCAIVRPGHPILGIKNPSLSMLVNAGWIVPPPGSVLRHRFELMFQDTGLESPNHLLETVSLVFLTKMLQLSDYIAIVPTDVGRYYAAYDLVSIVPIQLTCKMDAFGIITRNDRPLSPGARIVLRELKAAAACIYSIAER
jgi:DNA-binding transcriptional LysR family regulator